MVLAELQGLASELGISGTARMRKGQLIEAIKERQSGGGDTAAPAAAKSSTDSPAAGDEAPGHRALGTHPGAASPA